MKAKRVICVVKGHVWIAGRVADRVIRDLVPGRQSYHNRACSRCGAEQWNADDVEAEAERLRVLKERLGVTRTQANTKVVDPRTRPIDPNTFP